jgi:hypothetical protein
MWTINAEMKRRLNALEIDYLRRSEGIFRERVRNHMIKERISTQETILQRIEIRGLK